MYEVEFDAEACTCLHPESDHDDGPGCTMPECDCLAGYYFADEDGDW